MRQRVASYTPTHVIPRAYMEEYWASLCGGTSGVIVRSDIGPRSGLRLTLIFNCASSSIIMINFSPLPGLVCIWSDPSLQQYACPHI